MTCQAPFGAHQQVLGPAWLRVPWLQVLPFFSALVRRGDRWLPVARGHAAAGTTELTLALPDGSPGYMTRVTAGCASSPS